MTSIDPLRFTPVTVTVGASHLLLVSVACVTAMIVASLMVAVSRGWTNRADEWILRLSHHVPDGRDGKPRRLTTAMRDLTALGGDTLRLLFLGGCIAGLLADRRWIAAAAMAVIFAVARLILFVMKALVKRPRPMIGDHGVVTFTSSFPSGHTFMAVVLFLSAALILPVGAPLAVVITAILIALLVSLAIGITRMSFGVHWPSDIAVGWCAGLAWTSTCLLLLASVSPA